MLQFLSVRTVGLVPSADPRVGARSGGAAEPVDVGLQVAVLVDADLLQHLLVDERRGPVERPALSTRPNTRVLEKPGGLAVESLRDATFTWVYQPANVGLAKLYSKAKDAQWNATTDLDWSIDVDPMNSGGMGDYLSYVPSEEFARFNDRATERLT